MTSKTTKRRAEDMPASKPCWKVTAAGRTFIMAGEPCSYDEVLAFVKSIWPDASVA